MIRKEESDDWDLVEGDDEIVVPSPTNAADSAAPIATTAMDHSAHTERSDEEDDYSEARVVVADVERSSSVASSAQLVNDIDEALSEVDGDDDGIPDSAPSAKTVSDVKHQEESSTPSETNDNTETGASEKETEMPDNTDGTDGSNEDAQPERASAGNDEPPAAKFLKPFGWKPRHTASVRTWARKSKRVVSTASKNVRELNPDAFDAVTSQTRQAAGTSAQYVKESSRKIRDWDAERLQVVPATREIAGIFHVQARVLVKKLQKFEEHHKLLAKSKLYFERSAKIIQRFVRLRMRNQN